MDSRNNNGVHLNDNWDDADGYYSKFLVVIIIIIFLMLFGLLLEWFNN